MEISKENLFQIHKALYEIPKTFRDDMRVGARIYADEKILDDILHDRSAEQLVNVSTLPGIVGYALGMPDMHEGYGFPIGGVAATAINNQGVISPGGIGYDINCGVRLLSTTITEKEIRPYLENVATAIFYAVPSGVGRGGKIKLNEKELETILKDGAASMVKKGMGIPEDLQFCEEQGNLAEADPDCVSKKAKERGFDQLGTLGSGNHFLEIQVVEEIFDDRRAQIFGLEKGAVTIMIHCGSRGLGHQTCTDYVHKMLPKLGDWNINLPDKELACAPFLSPEGQEYFAAMCASANFAWANRQVIAHRVRESFQKVLGASIAVRPVYDLCHNIGKKETHIINGKNTELLVHRKGATRAFPAGHSALIPAYKITGHPVLIPGTMGTSSYVLAGTERGLEESFGSCCHGAGRRMSRVKAKKMVSGSALRKELEAKGIVIRCDSDAGLAEEAPLAYKDVDLVTNVVEQARLCTKVAKLKPIGVIKGG
jgi:tRNA-splicing ligase RtcB (3'-phosphate/5'-hydroxy nucleic acid ligase)